MLHVLQMSLHMLQSLQILSTRYTRRSCNKTLLIYNTCLYKCARSPSGRSPMSSSIILHVMLNLDYTKLHCITRLRSTFVGDLPLRLSDCRLKHHKTFNSASTRPSHYYGYCMKLRSPTASSVRQLYERVLYYNILYYNIIYDNILYYTIVYNTILYYRCLLWVVTLGLPGLPPPIFQIQSYLGLAIFLFKKQ